MYIKQFIQSNITSIYSYSKVLLHRRKVCIVNMNKGERYFHGENFTSTYMK